MCRSDASCSGVSTLKGESLNRVLLRICSRERLNTFSARSRSKMSANISW